MWRGKSGRICLGNQEQNMKHTDMNFSLLDTLSDINKGTILLISLLHINVMFTESAQHHRAPPPDQKNYFLCD